MFKSIMLDKWRQIESVHLSFDSPMTVITGANGSGKTTILNILSRHFGWNLAWTSTKSQSRGKSKFWSDAWELWQDSFAVKSDTVKIGEIEYESGGVCKLYVPVNVNEQYNINYQDQQSVLGLHIPSHAQPFNYSKVENIPTDPKTTSQRFQEYQNLLIQIYQSSRSQHNPGLVIKSSIIALAVFGYGNSVVIENREFIETFEALQDALRILLPKDLGFQRLEIRMPDVVLITESGTFSLDSVSGGIAALIGIAWQLHMYGVDKDKFAVTFDEPENHLHPAMQRELLPNLERAFPKARFVIATHSPFIVTSNPNAQIYSLSFKNGKVTSRHLKESELSGDYNETLQQILDVPITIPKWVEAAVKDAYHEAVKTGVTEESIQQFKKELERLRLYPSLFHFPNLPEGDDA